MSSVHDGIGRLRGGDPRRKTRESLVATAALRRAMELWTNKHALASCGDAMAPAASLCLTALQYYDELGILGGPTCREHEIVPGVTFDGVVATCMRELLDNAGSAQYSGKVIKLLGDGIDKYTFALSRLPVERRAKLVLSIIHYVLRAEDPDDSDSEFSFGRPIEMPKDSVNTILKAVCGSYPVVAKQVLQTAADGGEHMGPEEAGHNTDSRAFVYYLIRADKPSDEWKSLDLVKLAKEFDRIPYICSAPDDEGAQEKDECLRLSRGDKMHEDINEFLSRM